jgi:toxin FitB
MIIFDTNVISEIIKDQCDSNVQLWTASIDSDEACTTSINIAELYSGVAVLPNGKKKDGLRLQIDNIVQDLFHDRILAFDRNSAMQLSEISATLKTKGRTISLADGMIAAIAIQHDCKVASRDTQPYADAGLSFINPWNVREKA